MQLKFKLHWHAITCTASGKSESVASHDYMVNHYCDMKFKLHDSELLEYNLTMMSLAAGAARRNYTPLHPCNGRACNYILAYVITSPLP